MKSREPFPLLFSHSFNFTPISKVQTVSIPGWKRSFSLFVPFYLLKVIIVKNLLKIHIYVYLFFTEIIRTPHPG